MSGPDDQRIDDILGYWFGGPAESRQARWFGHDPAVDAEIRRRFLPLIEAAAAGELDAWATSARGALALVILLDQFPRNAFRATPGAFAHDAAALAITRATVAAGRDRELGWFERMMLRMPLQHAEDVATQAESLASFTALRDEAAAAGAPTDVVAALTTVVDFAGRHARIVERFGRYPHRNAILGRPSTPAEEAFLREPGSSF